MITWIRLTMTRRCGKCGALISSGALAKLYAIGPIKKLRCADCDGPAPPIASVIETRPAPVTLDLSRLGISAS